MNTVTNNCRGGTPWPPVSPIGLFRTTGGHGVPPLQLHPRRDLTFETSGLEASLQLDGP